MRRISFETAKLALEKGYKKGCDKVYTHLGDNLWSPYYAKIFCNGDDDGDSMYEAPFQEELQRWLREERQVSVLVNLDETLSYIWCITPLSPASAIQEFSMSTNVWCNDYEGCLEAGLYNALTQL